MSYMDNNLDSQSDPKQVLVGMSGGVDSSAAVLILKDRGYSVKGLILRVHDEHMSPEDLSNGKLPQSIWHAREAARRMRLDFTIRNVRDAFLQEVIEPFVTGCEARINPDPCVLCCAEFLFPQLFQEADRLECSLVASGHYAVIRFDEDRGRYVVQKALDLQNDESHVLYRLSQEQLARLITPLGTYEKEEIRNIARKARLKNAFVPESPSICFVPDGQYRQFLAENTSSEVPESTDDPMKKEALPATRILASSLCFSGIESLPSEGMHVRARIRSPLNESDAFARITEGGILEVQLEQPLRAAVPGQSIVLYDNDIVAMGGIIKENAF